ncbi:MAG: hypothetical protein ABJE95_36140 [Byssovorax sp.]
MKYAIAKVLVLVVATGSLIAACATGSDTTDFGAGGASGPGTSGNPDTTATSGAGGTGGVASGDMTTTATTGSGAPDGGGACIPKCNADIDCQNSCPAAQTGINCCDAPSGLCYNASTATCPAPKPDGGMMMPPY